jgi:hypothetical protein
VKGLEIGYGTQIRTKGSKHRTKTGEGVEKMEETKQASKKERKRQTGKEENK